MLPPESLVAALEFNPKAVDKPLTYTMRRKQGLHIALSPHYVQHDSFLVVTQCELFRLIKLLANADRKRVQRSRKRPAKPGLMTDTLLAPFALGNPESFDLVDFVEATESGARVGRANMNMGECLKCLGRRREGLHTLRLKA